MYTEVFEHLQKTTIPLIHKGVEEPLGACFATLDWAHTEENTFYRIEVTANGRPQLEEACELMTKQAECFQKNTITPDGKMTVSERLRIVEVSYMAARQDGRWSRAITTKCETNYHPTG